MTRPPVIIAVSLPLGEGLSNTEMLCISYGLIEVNCHSHRFTIGCLSSTQSVHLSLLCNDTCENAPSSKNVKRPYPGFLEGPILVVETRGHGDNETTLHLTTIWQL
jgi:hypothetical protein